jgi:tetratricopeptide (TPR) repeat protein
VCESGDSLELLTRLAERSMLIVRRPPSGGTRYEMLETLREYGRRRIDVDQRVRLFTTHAELFASIVREVGAELQTPSEPKAMARAEGSFADLRAAQRFALDIGDAETAFQLIGSIREFAMRAMRYEAFAWADAARRTAAEPDHPLRPLLTGISAYGAWVRGELDVAVALAHETRQREQALGLFPCGLAERVLGNVHYAMDRSVEGDAEVTRQVELAEASGNASRLVHALYMGAVGLSTAGDYERAREYVARARQIGESTGSPTDLASSAVAEGFATRNDNEAALAAFETADRLAQTAGNRWMSAFARTEVAGLLVHRGDLDHGSAMLASMVDLWYRAGEWSQQWHTLSRCLLALDRIDQHQLAAELVGAIEAHSKLGVPPMSTILREVVLGVRDSLSVRFSPAVFEELCASGAARSVVSVVHRTQNALLGRAISD